MNESSIAEVFRREYDESAFPAGFLAGYDRLECLADSHGTATFLVREKGGEKLSIAKCFDKAEGPAAHESAILQGLRCDGLPQYRETFENDGMTVVIREYVEGDPLDRRAAEAPLTRPQIVKLCVELCDILIYLHSQTPPVIHRDIKPQNVIVKPDGHVALIDFDIARRYSESAQTDTQFFGTREYAPPEQYGFTQTDCRADIYSFGALLRFLLTGSARENKNTRYYKPLERIVRKCTAFSPKERYADMGEVKKALLAANPRSQGVRTGLIAFAALAACALLAFGGVRLYRYLTYSPFTEGAIPAVLSDEERVTDAVAYMRKKYDTKLFDHSDDCATVGLLRQVLVEVYGLSHDYAYALPAEGVPHEDAACFLPWGWDDVQNLPRDVVVYAAVKLHSPETVADWSSLKDDNGYYPGVRVAVAFAQETGIMTGANRPDDITVGDLALILANADRVFAAAEG